MRKCFVITHGICGGFLTYDLFATEKTFSQLCSIDECHFTTDGVIVYTYLHFKQYVSRLVLAAFMEKMKSERNIILFDIPGYDSIGCSSDGDNITEHVGFQKLVDHYLKNDPKFRSCTDGSPGVTRGFLWDCDSMSRLKELVKTRSKRLAVFLETMEKEISENRQKAEMADVLQNLVNEQDAKIEQLGVFRFTCHVLKSRMVLLDQDTREMLLAPDTRGNPLIL